jgi:hypothetical protein
MKKGIILTIIWACIALIPSGLYLNHRHTQRENDALQTRDQLQLLRNAFIQSDYTNALKSLFTPAFRSEVELGAINFPRLYDWVTNRDYYLEDSHPKIRFWGDIGMLYPTRPGGTPDICVELQKIDGRWYFNGEIIPVVD